MEAHRNATADEALAQVADEETLLHDRVLETAITQLDELIGGFRASKVALLDSDNSYSSTLLHLLCVRAIAQFDEEVVWIDGGNVVDPYSISALCKRLRMDKRDVLSRVNISRAFTAYQLVTLIDERLEEQVERSVPCAVIVSSIAELFLDKDMKWMEAHQLLRRCVDSISRVTKEHETITIISNDTHHHPRPSPALTTLLYDGSDTVLQIRGRRNGLLMRSPRKDKDILFSPVPWNQVTLDEFRGGSYGKDGPDIPLGP